MQPLAKQFERPFQIDELYIRIDLQAFAVAALQRGACQYHIPAIRIPLEHRLSNGLQPRDAVFIVKRNAVRHFLDVGG